MILCAARVAPKKAVFRPALPLHSSAGHIGNAMTTKLTYADQLKHPNWQRKRLEALSAADFTCKSCEAKEKTLHVHHKKYVKGRKAWEYSLSELEVLCEDCHGLEHDDRDLMEDLLSASWHDETGDKMVLGFLAGFLLPMETDIDRLRLLKARRHPFFDIGFLVAALGPDYLIKATRMKIADGKLPQAEFIEEVLSGFAPEEK